MQYMGGKFRLRKEISSFLKDVRKSNQVYFEPFVGGASVLVEMSGNRIANDSCTPLISLYKHLQNGWVPPVVMTRELYDEVKARNDPFDPLTAFCGFGCSYGGAYFSSYVPVGKKNHPLITHKSLIKQSRCFDNVEFHNKDYREFEPIDQLIYCDPPYRNTRRYIAVDKFDNDEFWETVRKWARYNTVVVSEYVAPDDFDIVKSFEVKTPINKHKICNENPKIEKLFMLRK